MTVFICLRTLVSAYAFGNLDCSLGSSPFESSNNNTYKSFVMHLSLAQLFSLYSNICCHPVVH